MLSAGLERRERAQSARALEEAALAIVDERLAALAFARLCCGVHLRVHAVLLARAQHAHTRTVARAAQLVHNLHTRAMQCRAVPYVSHRARREARRETRRDQRSHITHVGSISQLPTSERALETRKRKTKNQRPRDAEAAHPRGSADPSTFTSTAHPTHTMHTCNVPLKRARSNT